jgi:hypothetical protein
MITCEDIHKKSGTLGFPITRQTYIKAADAILPIKDRERLRVINAVQDAIQRMGSSEYMRMPWIPEHWEYHRAQFYHSGDPWLDLVIWRVICVQTEQANYKLLRGLGWIHDWEVIA